MRIGILQPGYLPWLGFFEQLAKADTFVLYNDTQYTKQDWRNRNSIKAPGRAKFLTVPVEKVRTKTLIKDVRISYDQCWDERHINILRMSYQKAPYFKCYFDGIRECIQANYGYLQDLDFALIKKLGEFLGLEDKHLIWSSEMRYERTENKSMNLLNICLALGADSLYDGKAAQEFLKVDLFNSKGITVRFQDYRHPVYPQLWGEFVPYLSVVDLLFNTGPESLNYILGKKGAAK